MADQDDDELGSLVAQIPSGPPDEDAEDDVDHQAIIMGILHAMASHLQK